MKELVVSAVGIESVFIMFMESDFTARSYQRIGAGYGDLDKVVTIKAGEIFGGDCTSLDDINEDGVNDIAVGQQGYANWVGAVYILHLDAAGIVIDGFQISHGTGGFTADFVPVTPMFGFQVESLGDFNNDGSVDIAVTPWFYDEDGDSHVYEGGVFLIFLDPNEKAVLSHQRLSQTSGNLGFNLATWAFFGTGLGSADFNGDNIPDVAICSIGMTQDANRAWSGIVFLLFLNNDGTVLSHIPIGTNDIPSLITQSKFGEQIVGVDDVNGDSVPDLMAFAHNGGVESGYYVVFLDPEAVAISCESLSVPNSNISQGVVRKTFDPVVEVSCDEGYTTEDDQNHFTTYCGGSGQAGIAIWREAEECLIVNCTTPPIPNSDYNDTNVTGSYQDTFVITCDSTHLANGLNGSITCQADGTFSWFECSPNPTAAPTAEPSDLWGSGNVSSSSGTGSSAMGTSIFMFWSPGYQLELLNSQYSYVLLMFIITLFNL